MLTGTNALSTFIKNEMAHHEGRLTFARFMELALYHPEQGYYTRHTMELGRAGDFTTASEISPLYAQCFASQCQEISSQIGTAAILEVGAGTGRFAGDLLAELARLGALPQHYFIYEISPSLRAKQQAYLLEQHPELIQRVTWLESLPTQFNGIVIANEVLDALPVHCFQIVSQGVKERFVSAQDNEFAWSLGAPSSAALEQALALIQEQYQLAPGYRSEICLALTEFLPALIQSVQSGVLLIADYGYGQREYYHPERQRGTLTCFYQHHRHDDPLLRPGEQDITAHVDFTRVIEIAALQGCSLGGFTTQAGFLLSNGLIERAAALEATLSTRDLFSLQQQIKTLTMPTEMGERVRVMALTKGCDPTLSGFTFANRRSEL